MERKEHYIKLDYLRIISCIMVLLYHLNILKGGFLAVCTFFTLSGYLDCITALKKEKFSIKSYYINRFKKIYIPLLIVVFMTLIIFKLFQQSNWMNLKPETNSVLFGYNNFWQLNANLDYFTKNVNSPFIHLWYISILMQFELLFPIVFVLLKKINKKLRKDISTLLVLILTIILTAVFFVMSATQDIMIVYYNTFARSFSILFGVLLALLHYKYNFKFSRIFERFNGLIYILYSIILIVLCIFVSSESNNYAIYMFITTIISIRLIEYSINGINKNNKLVEFLSRESYGIYLVQYPVIFFLQNMPSVDVIKIPLIIIITFAMSLILNLLTKNNSKLIAKIICIIVIIIGGFLLLTQKDYSEEMNDLQNVLNENSKANEKQNNDFLNSKNEVKEESVKEVSATKEDIEKEKKKIAQTVKQLPIIGVGDSVLLGVSNKLRKIFPNGYFDGKVSRTIVGGKEVLQKLKNQGKLSNTLVLALANNGDYSDSKNRNLMKLVGDREVYWVNAVGADDPKFNSRFKKFASDYPNIHIVEWDVVSKGHPEYFYADGIHIKGDGIGAYANTIYEAIYNNYLEKRKLK